MVRVSAPLGAAWQRVTRSGRVRPLALALGHEKPAAEGEYLAGVQLQRKKPKHELDPKDSHQQ